MKYVRFENGNVVLFGNQSSFCHKDFEKMGKPVSAGFCAVDIDRTIFVFGDSITLNLGQKSDDADQIAKMMKI